MSTVVGEQARATKELDAATAEAVVVWRRLVARRLHVLDSDTVSLITVPA
jgi:hypothetical protein